MASDGAAGGHRAIDVVAWPAPHVCTILEGWL